jgi:Spy/CpxP family protein refolding chaperone
MSVRLVSIAAAGLAAATIMCSAATADPHWGHDRPFGYDGHREHRHHFIRPGRWIAEEMERDAMRERIRDQQRYCDNLWNDCEDGSRSACREYRDECD